MGAEKSYARSARTSPKSLLMGWVFDTLGVAGGGYELNTGSPSFSERWASGVLGLKLMGFTWS